ncbi:hypothetical protein, partial [Streptomyces sp. WAC 06725]|uniref:hypothetical protein n=1 Tax=Streptomyces sp. WAC 06725 TaxID=2203209 RepID=UPI001C8B64FB
PLLHHFAGLCPPKPKATRSRPSPPSLIGTVTRTSPRPSRRRAAGRPKIPARREYRRDHDIRTEQRYVELDNVNNQHDDVWFRVDPHTCTTALNTDEGKKITFRPAYHGVLNRTTTGRPGPS